MTNSFQPSISKMNFPNCTRITFISNILRPSLSDWWVGLDRKSTMFYMMFLILGIPFKAMAKAWLFSQKCNPVIRLKMWMDFLCQDIVEKCSPSRQHNFVSLNLHMPGCHLEGDIRKVNWVSFSNSSTAVEPCGLKCILYKYVSSFIFNWFYLEVNKVIQGAFFFFTGTPLKSKSMENLG